MFQKRKHNHSCAKSKDIQYSFVVINGSLTVKQYLRNFFQDFHDPCEIAFKGKS